MPQVPPVSGGVELDAASAAALAPGGALARAIPAFEPREAQRKLAGAVSRTFADGGVLLAEAGTGTGKTLAYLIPAILSRHRVLVSTGTKNLQEQIYFKDLPVLREALGVPFTATYMKGRGNYLCLHRFEAWRDSGAIRSFDETQSIRMIDDWSRDSETGDRAELEDLPEDSPFWNDISASAENCIGAECPRYDDCFVTRMRQRAAASDVVIVNHHLLVRGRGRAAQRLRRGHPILRAGGHRRGASARGRRHAVFRPRHQQLPRRLADPRSRPRRRLRPAVGP